MNVRTSTWKTYPDFAQMRFMTSDAARLASDRLKALLARADLRGDRAAAALGFKGRSSLQNYLDDAEKDIFPLDFARRAAQALVGLGTPAITVSDVFALFERPAVDKNAVNEATQYRMLALEPPKNVVTLAQVAIVPGLQMPVYGKAHASFWMPRAPSMDDPSTWLTIPFGKGIEYEVNQYALEILGPSLNQIAIEGDFAILERFASGRTDFDQDDVVHAQRVTDLGVEWTLKKVRYKGGKCLLCPDSDHPDHQEALPFTTNNLDAQVSVLGIVVGYYRPVRKSKGVRFKR